MDIPDGRGLDWVTIVSALAPLYDVSAAYVNQVVPILEAGGHTQLVEQFGNSLAGAFKILEDRHDFLEAVALYSHDQTLIRTHEARLYSEVKGAQLRAGSALQATVSSFYESVSEQVARLAAKEKAAEFVQGGVGGEKKKKKGGKNRGRSGSSDRGGKGGKGGQRKRSQSRGSGK
mgnify:CR=1 FL=1